MKRRILCAGLAGIMAMGMLAGCGKKEASDKAENGQEAEVLSIQLGHINPATEYSQCHYLCEQFAEKIGELSDGTIEVEVIADGQLGGERDMVEGMQMGTIDMMSIASFSMGPFVPSVQVLDLPYLFDNAEEAYLVMDDEALMKPITDELYDTCGVKVLGWGAGGFRNTLSNKKAVNNVSDLKGQKLRLPETSIYVDTFQALGANPTTMAFSETFTAIEQNTIDGLELPILSIYPSKYHEVCEYLSLTEHIYTNFALCVSSDIWESLSEEQQRWFQEASDYAVETEREFVAEAEEELLTEMEKTGIKVNEVENKEEFKEAVAPVYDQYQDEIGKELIDSFQKKLEE